MSYVAGATVKCSAVFRDADNALSDPTSISFRITSPRGTAIAYTTPDPAIVRDSLGTYHVVVSVNDAGTWKYRFEGIGAAPVVGEKYFGVQRSAF